MGKSLQYKDYDRRGPLDSSYVRLVFEELIGDASIQMSEMESLIYIYRNIVFSTEPEDLRGVCSYRKCYDETRYPLDKLWVIDHGDGNSPDFYCEECMKEYEDIDKYETLAEVIRKTKNSMSSWGGRYE